MNIEEIQLKDEAIETAEAWAKDPKKARLIDLFLHYGSSLLTDGSRQLTPEAAGIKAELESKGAPAEPIDLVVELIARETTIGFPLTHRVLEMDNAPSLQESGMAGYGDGKFKGATALRAEALAAGWTDRAKLDPHTDIQLG